MDTPIIFQWTDDEVMMPLRRFKQRCAEEYVIGEFYRLVPITEASLKSRGHYFVSLKEKWMSLPPHIERQFPTVHSLRKHALIMTGFRKERKFVTESAREARRFAAFLRQTAYQDYTLISIKDDVVLEWTAVSQARRAMGAKTFQESKQAVLDWVDGLLGVKDKAA